MPGTPLTFTPEFERLLTEALKEHPVQARDILALSDFYVEEVGRPTPWSHPGVLPATLAYFMPLNYARLMATFREVRRFFKGDEFAEVWDFGSGLGTAQWVLEDQPWLDSRPLFTVESSVEAQEYHARLESLRAGRWKATPVSRVNPKAPALGIFSYSFLEMQTKLPDFSNFEHLLILEPSVRGRGRALQEWRSKFMLEGFTPLAPCTHLRGCPLLVRSKTDWCHSRIFFEPPEWWLDIEKNLPMTNRTLTYSYLLMSRSLTHQDWAGAARVLSPTLNERGKTRQLICRGDDREFLAWLRRGGEPPTIPHGALIRDDLNQFEKKSDEIRAGRDLAWTE